MKIIVFADYTSELIPPMMNLYVMDGEFVLTGMSGRTTNALMDKLKKLQITINGFLMREDPFTDLKYDANTNTFYWKMEEDEQKEGQP